MADKKGIVDISALSTPPEKHELATDRYFAKLGKDIVFTQTSHKDFSLKPLCLLHFLRIKIDN